MKPVTASSMESFDVLDHGEVKTAAGTFYSATCNQDGGKMPVTLLVRPAAGGPLGQHQFSLCPTSNFMDHCYKLNGK